MKALTNELSSLKASRYGGGTGGQNTSGGPKGPGGPNPKWKIDEWRLTKIKNGKEFGENFHPTDSTNTRPYFFCDSGHFNNGKRVEIYCTHTPDKEHKAWLAKKEERKELRKEKRGKRERETLLPMLGSPNLKSLSRRRWLWLTTSRRHSRLKLSLRPTTGNPSGKRHVMRRETRWPRR